MTDVSRVMRNCAAARIKSTAAPLSPRSFACPPSPTPAVLVNVLTSAGNALGDPTPDDHDRRSVVPPAHASADLAEGWRVRKSRALYPVSSASPTARADAARGRLRSGPSSPK